MLNDTEAANLQQTHDAVARIEQALWTGNDSKNKPRGSIGALIARIAEKTEGQGLDLGKIKAALKIGN